MRRDHDSKIQRSCRSSNRGPDKTLPIQSLLREFDPGGGLNLIAGVDVTKLRVWGGRARKTTKLLLSSQQLSIIAAYLTMSSFLFRRATCATAATAGAARALAPPRLAPLPASPSSATWLIRPGPRPPAQKRIQKNTSDTP